MANQEHIDILKQGVEVWNKWRQEHPTVGIDLIGANLTGANLVGVNFSTDYLSFDNRGEANLSGARLSHAKLSGARFRNTNLREANLTYADLRAADLKGAILYNADLSEADLSEADLSVANLGIVNLSRANLSGARLSHTQLGGAILREVNLSNANLNHANIGWTLFVKVDLHTVKGLETVQHRGPSTVGTDTLLLSQGAMPESFLRGVGLSDTFIEYIHSLIDKPIDYYSCFISYSSKDQEFVERLNADLQSKGVRCWFAPDDLKIGDKIRDRIDQSIRVHDKLLLVLSEHSVNSSWVEFEVEAAFAKESSRNTPMLFPIRIDAAVKDSSTSWAAHIRRTRNIADFSNWKQHDAYQKVLNRLLRDLKPEIPAVTE